VEPCPRKFLRLSRYVAIVASCAAALAHGIEPDPITPERPWFIFRAADGGSADALAYADRLRGDWQSLNDSLWPFASLELPGPRTGFPGWGDRFGDVVNELQVAEIPTVVSITDSPRTLFPLDQLRALFDRFTLIRGVRVTGLQFDQYPSVVLISANFLYILSQITNQEDSDER